MATDPTLKTVENDGDVDAFLASVADETRRRDARTLLGLMTWVTGHTARLWGPSIVGFDRYHYVSSSGREGDWPATAFSPRKAATTVYLMDGVDAHTDLLGRLGPHSVGKGCLYMKRLADVDLEVLETIVRRSYAKMIDRPSDG